VGRSKALLLERLEPLLRERRAAGVITALVIDEAQSLSAEMLEEIRLLANMETPSAKLLPVVLAGQLELAARLEDPTLRQLKQRVTLRCELEPFGIDDTASYIASRFSTAGGVASRVFTREAILRIHEDSRGIPRTINVICDNALVSGVALGRHRIDLAMVREVCRDLCLKSNSDAVSSALHDNDALSESATVSQYAVEEPSSSTRISTGIDAPALFFGGARRIINE
jgi:type II secretory pathway predicted ATPase ExeA